MKVLLIGGAGMVGSFITPYLAKEHELRVLDLAVPKHESLVDHRPGSISSPDDVARRPRGHGHVREPRDALATGWVGHRPGPHHHQEQLRGQHPRAALPAVDRAGDGHQGRRAYLHDERPLPRASVVPVRGDRAARFTLRIRADQGPGRADLRVLRALVRHAPDRTAHHRSTHSRGLPGGAPDAHPRGPLRHGRGGPGAGLPGRHRGRADGPRPLRRRMDRRRRARGDAQPDEGADAAGLDAGEPPAAGGDSSGGRRGSRVSGAGVAGRGAGAVRGTALISAPADRRPPRSRGCVGGQRPAQHQGR